MPPVSSCFWGLWRVREKNKKLHYHFIDFMHCCVFPVCLRYWGCYQCTIWCSWWHCCSQGHQEKTGDDINLRKGLEPSCISLYFSKFFFGYWLLLHSFFNLLISLFVWSDQSGKRHLTRGMNSFVSTHDSQHIEELCYFVTSGIFDTSSLSKKTSFSCSENTKNANDWTVSQS